MENKQTPVEFLIENLKMILPISQFNDVVMQDVFKQSKEMEKQQIIEFGKKVADNWGMTEVPIQEIEKFLNNTYGSKGSDEHIVDTNEIVSSQIEISDEEIEKAGWDYELNQIGDGYEHHFIEGAKWYREQLKKKLL